MRFDTSLARGVVDKAGRGSLGSPREVAAACFHAARRTSLHSAVRQTFDRLVSALHVRVASPEHLRAQLCPSLSEQAGLPGFLPSSRPHQRASTDREASQASLRAVHRRSQPLDGFLRTLAPGLVSSPSRVQGSSRSGASLSTQRPSLRQRGLPPRRCHVGARRSLRDRRPLRSVPRPRGFDLRGAACTRQR